MSQLRRLRLILCRLHPAPYLQVTCKLLASYWRLTYTWLRIPHTSAPEWHKAPIEPVEKLFATLFERQAAVLYECILTVLKCPDSIDGCWSMDADLPLPLQSPLYIAHEPHATNHCTFYLLSNHHTPRSIDCNQQKIRSLFVWFLDFDLEFDFRFRMASPTRGGRSRQFQFCVSTREATLIKYSIFWIRRMARDSLVVLHFWTRQFWQLHTASVRYRWPKRLSEETKQRKVLLSKITQCVHTSSVAHQRSHLKVARRLRFKGMLKSGQFLWIVLEEKLKKHAKSHRNVFRNHLKSSESRSKRHRLSAAGKVRSTSRPIGTIPMESVPLRPLTGGWPLFWPI